MADHFTTAAQMRENIKMLMMQLNANWEEYLTPGLLYINLMGELVFITSCYEFCINKYAPFKYIKDLDSMRACYGQIRESSRHAFSEANKNMDQIRIHTGTVPGYMNTVVYILFNATNKVIENLLPNQLQNIREIADDCVVLADAIEKKYTDVINLIQELLEACTNPQHFYGKELEDVKKKLEEAKLKEQAAKDLNERSKKAMEAMAKQVEEEEFKKSMDSLPSGWEMIGMDFVEGLTTAVTGLINERSATAFTPKPSMMYKEQSNSSESKSAGQRPAETARFKIEQSRKQLKQTREQYEKCVENMEKNQRELNEILIEMQSSKFKENYTFKKTDFINEIEMLFRVKEQWVKMVLFFQMVSNIIKTSLSRTLHNFVKTAEETKKLTYNGKLFTKDLLYSQAFQASNIASLVHMISTTYTEVSNKYLMDRVSSLGKLMAMDKDKPEFLSERLNLQESCRDAQDGILRLVLKNKKEFERKTDARMAKIEGELMAVLPAAPPQETERIKEIVQASFSEEEQADYC